MSWGGMGKKKRKKAGPSPSRLRYICNDSTLKVDQDGLWGSGEAVGKGLEPLLVGNYHGGIICQQQLQAPVVMLPGPQHLELSVFVLNHL